VKLHDVRAAWAEERNFEFGITRFAEGIGIKDIEQYCSNVLAGGALYLVALGHPRAATTRRIVPSLSTSAERAFARRQMHRGRPIFSYNVVDLVVPQTCIYRGESHPTESFAGKRGHMVIGHWRLIAGVAEPFFTWVDGHERGDRDLGYITKERSVSAHAGGMRKGFVVPNMPAAPGERRAAQHKEERPDAPV
jgi:hypothetical protein